MNIQVENKGPNRICEEFSAGYYGVCAVGGMLSAGTTHLAITPLDVLKVNMQVYPVKYKSIWTCFSTIFREQGPSAFPRGWAAKFLGYGSQGAWRLNFLNFLVVKKIGFVKLFTRSLPIRIMLVGPAMTMQWLFYDSIKLLSGLPTSGLGNTRTEENRTA